MGIIIKILITAVAVFVASYFLTGVHIDTVQTTIIVALVLALLNTFLRPILVFFTLPITVVTLGLFLLIINVIIIKLADYLVPGFKVDSWWDALLFSLIVAVVAWILDALFGGKD
jgi:putative membrane protein